MTAALVKRLSHGPNAPCETATGRRWPSKPQVFIHPVSISHFMSWRKPKKSSKPSSGQPNLLSSSSSIGFRSPKIATPKPLMSLRMTSLGRPFKVAGSIGVSWVLAVSSAYSCFLERKNSRNCSTSFCVNFNSSINFFMRSSSACAYSISNILASCTNVQKEMAPSPPTSSTPASAARSFAIIIFCTSACCSSRDFGCQSNTFRMPKSSVVSMSPPLSLSCLSKRTRNSSTLSSVKPAFFFSFATNSFLQASTRPTKASKSNESMSLYCVSLGKDVYANSFNPKPIAFLWILPVSFFLYRSKTERMLVSSFSRLSRMRRMYSRKSSLPLLFSSTCATKMRIWSRVSVYPSARKSSASSRAEISPVPSLSKRSKTFRNSLTTALRKPSR
mmetsp:Transcript_86561/g.242314  ORF Transcript_86561/g.242314 Transcript_86561/m.242314 type:complete len:388 (-) Transcript_86561:1032-2195(-)